MNQRIMLAAAAVAMGLTAGHTFAAEKYWDGGGTTSALGEAGNYSDDVAPVAADNLNIGNTGTATSDANLTVNGIRIGHSEATLPGSGQVDVTAGTLTVNGTTLMGPGTPTGAVIVGANADGTLNVSGGTLNVNLGPMFVGYDGATDTLTNLGTGTLNISGSGIVDVKDNRLGIGEGSAGSVTVSDNGTLMTSRATGNADLIVGVSQTASFLQSGGTVDINRDVIIGRRTANNTTFTMTAGTFNGGAGLSVGDDGSPGNTTQSDSGDNTLVDIQGGSFFVNGSAFIGRNLADGTTLSVSGGSFTTGNNVEIGLDSATNTEMNVSGGTVTIGTVDTSGGTFSLGRGGSNNTTLNLSGGSITVQAGVDANSNPSEGLFVMGDQQGANTVPAPTNVVTNHNNGTLNARGVVIGDNLGGSTTPGSDNATYHLSGTGILNASSYTIIGRRLEGTMNQTGGTANLGDLSIANNQGASTDPNVSGIYNISGGALNANSIAIAPNGTDFLPAGTGELNVLGDDSTISVTGNFSSSSDGTLAFELESGDLLTLIDVDGTAVFDLGSKLVFDTTNASPTLGLYDLLTASSITDNGIAFTGPSGWGYQIVSGGNGQILQVVVPEPSTFGLIAAAGCLALRRRRRA